MNLFHKFSCLLHAVFNPHPSPHIPNPLVGKCLHQLSFTDASHIQDCYLYKMAAQTTLADFKYIVLVSSVQVS